MNFRVVGVAAAVVFGLAVGMQAFRVRVLLSERRITPGQTFVVEGYGDLGKNEQATLACRYFTGRSVKTRVFWYSPAGMVGRDECPLFVRDD